jgi:DNA-binding NarL/FixJ family response regulator
MLSINVVVADHQPIFAEGVRRVLDTQHQVLSCRVAGVVDRGSMLFSMLQGCTTDVLLLDPGMPEVEGAATIADLKRQYAHMRVLVVTEHNDPRLVKASLKAGADGYILKTTSQDELMTAIHEVVAGHIYIGSGVSSVIRSLWQSETLPLVEDSFAKKYSLTRREVEIMKLIGQALTNKEIGERLYISDQTVSVHRKNIMRKLKVNSTANLIRIAFENNLAEVAA